MNKALKQFLDATRCYRTPEENKLLDDKYKEVLVDIGDSECPKIVDINEPKSIFNDFDGEPF